MRKPDFLARAPEPLQDLHDDLAVMIDRAFDLDQPDTGDALSEAHAILKRALRGRLHTHDAVFGRRTGVTRIPLRGTINEGDGA